jgi:hypothetical protein
MTFSSLWDDLSGLSNLFILLAAFALIGFMIWLTRRSGTVTGFTIRVSDESVDFSGRFPQAMQSTVINFLRNDLAIPGTYEIRGRWDDQLLIIIVKGNAAPMEQRIRNFLKLTLKKPT